MKSLANAENYAEIRTRIGALTPSDERLWGEMGVHCMVCHLSDAFRLCTGERTASDVSGVLQRTLVKWVALRLPVQWPKNTQTVPEIKQGVGGILPTRFDDDRRELLQLMERLRSPGASLNPAHPIFGRMTEREWMRWGYLHTDHHLRQFGR
jgi:hypothetical protein